MAIGGAQELLQFLITANGQQAIQEINAVGKAATRQEQLIAKTNKKSAAAYTALGAKQLAFGVAAGAGIVAAAAAASDLDKSVSRVNATYAEGASEVIRWAEGANKVFLSDRQAASYAANVGEAAQGLGVAADEATRLIPQVIGVVAQLSTLKGLDMENSIESVSAALRGEFDATQKLIPALSAKRIVDEALVASGKERASDLTTQEKALATLNIILNDGTEIAAGNAEALDSLSARWAKLKSNFDDALVTFGEGALPAVEGAAGIFGAVAESAAAVPPPILQAAGALATLGATISAGAGLVNLSIGGYQKLGGSIKQFATNVIGAQGSYGKLTSRLGVGAAAATAAYLALDAFGRSMNESNDYAGKMENALYRVENGFNRLDGARDFAQAAQDEWRGLDDVVSSVGDTLDGLDIEYWEEFADTAPIEQGRDALMQLREEIEATTDPNLADRWANLFGGDQNTPLEEQLKNVDDLLERIDQRAADERIEFIIDVEGGADAEGALGEVEDAAEEAEDALESYDAALAALGSASGYVESQLAVAEALREQARAREDLLETLADGEADDRDREDALLAVASATRDVASAELDRNRALAELNQLGPEALFEQLAVLDSQLASGLISPEAYATMKSDIEAALSDIEIDPIEPTVSVAELERGMEAWGDRLSSQAETVPVEADTAPAEGKLNVFTQYAQGLQPDVQIGGNTAPAEERTQWVYDYVSGLWVEMPVGADTSEADQKNNALRGRVSRGVTVPVDADTSAAERKIYGLNGKRITLSAAVNRIEGVPGAGAVSAPEPGGIAGPGIEVDLSGLFGKGGAVGSGSGPSVGTYVRSQTINLPRGADAREVELAQRRYSARNGSPRR